MPALIHNLFPETSFLIHFYNSSRMYLRFVLLSWLCLFPALPPAQLIDSTSLVEWMADFPYQDTLIVSIGDRVYQPIYQHGCEECPPKAVEEFKKAETWNLHNDIETRLYYGYSHKTISNGLIQVTAFGTYDREYFLLVFQPDATLVNVLVLKAALGDAGQSEQYGVYDYTGKKIMLWKATINEFQDGRKWGEQHDSTITTYKFQPDGIMDTLLYETVSTRKAYGSRR